MWYHRARLMIAGLMLASWLAPTVAAQDAALPTLPIKGEVVSVDPAENAIWMVKVRDRYGFETPIHVTGETDIKQGDQTVLADDLQVGASVEVEYNFDVNTAKRFAVRVSMSGTPVSSVPAAVSDTTAQTAAVEAASTVETSASTMVKAVTDAGGESTEAVQETATEVMQEPTQTVDQMIEETAAAAEAGDATSQELLEKLESDGYID